MKNYLIGSLGTLAFGLLAAGCAGSTTDTAAPEPTADKWAAGIGLAAPIAVTGCNASASFHINSLAALNNIVYDASNVNAASVRMQLSAVDQWGQQSLIQQNATQASSTIQSMINTATNSMNSSAIAQNRASQQYLNSAATTTVASEQAATTQTYNDQMARASSVQTATHADNHDQAVFNSSNIAQGSFSSGNNSAFTNQFAGSNISNVGDVGYGGLAFFNSAFANNYANLASAQNSTAAQNSFANANNSASAHANNSSVDTATSYVDSASAQNSLVATNSRALTTTASAANQAAGAFDSLNDSAYNQAAASTYSNASNFTAQNTLVFSNLQSLQASHYLLNVQFTAQDSQAVMQLFTTNNTQVLDQNQFSAAFPSCVW